MGEQDEKSAHDGGRLQHKLPIPLLPVHDRVPCAPADEHATSNFGPAARRWQYDHDRGDRLNGKGQCREQCMQCGATPASNLH
eukprot:scaffold15589_cov111-Isochrysis_galbana.AAC.8